MNIKWGKEKFADVHCNTDEPPIVFKATLFSLSGVQPDRQKVMYKGVVIKVSCIDLVLQQYIMQFVASAFWCMLAPEHSVLIAV